MYAVTLQNENFYNLVGEALVLQGELTGDYTVVTELTVICGLECSVVSDEDGTYIILED